MYQICYLIQKSTCHFKNKFFKFVKTAWLIVHWIWHEFWTAELCNILPLWRVIPFKFVWRILGDSTSRLLRYFMYFSCWWISLSCWPSFRVSCHLWIIYDFVSASGICRIDLVKGMRCLFQNVLCWGTLKWGRANLRAVMWFHFTISSLVLLPIPIALSIFLLTGPFSWLFPENSSVFPVKRLAFWCGSCLAAKGLYFDWYFVQHAAMWHWYLPLCVYVMFFVSVYPSFF